MANGVNYVPEWRSGTVCRALKEVGRSHSLLKASEAILLSCAYVLLPETLLWHIPKRA